MVGGACSEGWGVGVDSINIMHYTATIGMGSNSGSRTWERGGGKKHEIEAAVCGGHLFWPPCPPPRIRYWVGGL